MEKEKLMDLLRNPKKYQKKTASSAPARTDGAPVRRTKSADRVIAVAGGVVTALVLASLLFIFSARKRADNITSSLDPSVLKGLVVDRTFTPGTGKRYVQISEGQDRNVSVRELGSTLPVISRYNYRALTPANYGVIGAAPWALSINVSSNLEDPDLLRYLFNQEETIKSFLARADVAPLLADPAALAKAAADETALKAFFSDETVQQVLNSPKLLKAIAGSRLFSYLLVSKAGKFYRDRPQAAAALVNASPTLRALKKNPNVRKETAENNYLKKISATLLK